MKLFEPRPGLREATPEEIRAYAKHQHGSPPKRREIVELIVEDLDDILAE